MGYPADPASRQSKTDAPASRYFAGTSESFTSNSTESQPMTSFLVSVPHIRSEHIHVRDSESGELLVVDFSDSTHLHLTNALAEKLHSTLGNALEARGLRVATPADLISKLKALANDLRWDDLGPWAERVGAIVAESAAATAAAGFDNEAVAR